MYKERPLIGRVITTNKEGRITVEWMMGLYSRRWKEWKGRERGKLVIYTDEVEPKDVVLRDIEFTHQMKLAPATIVALKEGGLQLAAFNVTLT